MAKPVPDRSAACLRQFVVARILARASAMMLDAYAARGNRLPPGKRVPPRYRDRAAIEIRRVICRDAQITPARYADVLEGKAGPKIRDRVWRALGAGVGTGVAS